MSSIQTRGPKTIATFRRLLAHARSRFGDPETNSDFETEIAGHLELLTERYVRQGMNPEDARDAARRQFGNTTLLRENHHAMLAFPSFEAVGRALRFARALQESGADQEAILELERTLALDPDHERAHYVLARIHQKAGNADAARREFDQHAQIKKRDSDAQYRRLLISIRE